MDFAAADEGANMLDNLHGERAVAGDLVLWVFKLFFHAERSSLRLSLRRVTREERDS
jgi:hypothetical protein